MSAVATTADPTPKPSRSGRLLNLVRKLIDFGHELAAKVRHLAATDPAQIWVEFATKDVAKVLDRISHAVLRANALEARLTSNAKRLDREPKPAGTPSPPRKPRAPHKPAEAETDPVLARLPTEAEIAAEIRHRPIGEVILDICLDLGIGEGHPLWPEVEHAVMQHGGNMLRFIRRLIDRAMEEFDPFAPFDFGTPPPGWSPLLQATGGTDPP